MRRALLSILLVLLPALTGAQTFVRWIPPPNVASFYETDTKVVFTKPVAPGSSDSQLLGDTTPTYWQSLYLSRSIQGSKSKALTESAATEFVRVAVPQTAGANFAGGEAIYTVYASDGTDTQSLSGMLKFDAVNKAGTETCQIEDDQNSAAAVSAGTLTCTLTCVTGLTDLIGLAANCVSSLTQTTFTINYRLNMTQPNTVTPQ